jgi:myo-inositol 2-dehydrogenase / D-chiro-inositol 1-dehydrogenase
VTHDQRTRVAVVGTGPWWGREHARVYAERPDVELCAVVGSTPERAAVRAREFRANPYVDLEEMLERERPDLVSICLANEGHFEPTLKVIRAGFPLLVEKPLVFDLDEADILLREAEARSLFFAINFNHRYATPVAMAAGAVRAGDLGELVFATWRFGGEPGTSSHPHANLIETQCHGLDMLEHLCGPINSVTAQMTDKTGRGYSTLVAALHFANGAVGSLLAGRLLQRPRPPVPPHLRQARQRPAPGLPGAAATTYPRPRRPPRPGARPGHHRLVRDWNPGRRSPRR